MNVHRKVKIKKMNRSVSGKALQLFITWRAGSKDENGEYVWNALGAFATGSTADYIEKYKKLNDDLFIENGELIIKDYTKKDGSPAKEYKIFIKEVG